MCDFKTCWEDTEAGQEVALMRIFQKQSTLTNIPRSKTAVLKGPSWPHTPGLSCSQGLAQFPHYLCSMHICGNSDISPGVITSPTLLRVPPSVPLAFLFPSKRPCLLLRCDSSLKGHLRLPYSLVNVQEHLLFKNHCGYLTLPMYLYCTSLFKAVSCPLNMLTALRYPQVTAYSARSISHTA